MTTLLDKQLSAPSNVQSPDGSTLDQERAAEPMRLSETKHRAPVHRQGEGIGARRQAEKIGSVQGDASLSASSAGSTSRNSTTGRLGSLWPFP
jgi:hypothetical protein